MDSAPLEAPELKALLKQALAETLTEQRELLREVFADALEDIAMTEAIREGEDTELVDRETVFALLESSS